MILTTILRKYCFSVWVLFPFLLAFSCARLNALKIDRVILATNDNPTYLEFWPIVAPIWEKIIGVKPTLALIGDQSLPIDESLGDVIRFAPLPHVSTALQSQLIRLLLPIYFDNEVCLISDIDMLPLNKEYFCDPITDIPDNFFVVFRDGAYDPELERYPMCYNVASGKIFKEIFKITSPKEISQTISAWSSLGYGWCTDEKVLYQHLNNWMKQTSRCVLLHHPVEKRIDRECWEYDRELLKKHYYIDSHMLRSYSSHKKEIDLLIRDSGFAEKTHPALALQKIENSQLIE